jgi:hypothetical protein
MTKFFVFVDVVHGDSCICPEAQKWGEFGMSEANLLTMFISENPGG